MIIVAPLSGVDTSNSTRPARWLSREAALLTVENGEKSWHRMVTDLPAGMVSMDAGVLMIWSLIIFIWFCVFGRAALPAGMRCV